MSCTPSPNLINALNISHMRKSENQLKYQHSLPRACLWLQHSSVLESLRQPPEVTRWLIRHAWPVAVAHPVAGLFCTMRTPILYPLSEEPSWSQGSACLPFSQLMSEESEEFFAVLNGEPGRRIKFNFGEPEREAIVEALTK